MSSELVVKVQRHEPDELDLQCDKIYRAMSDIKTPHEKITLLEQVIDYLRMEIAADKDAD